MRPIEISALSPAAVAALDAVYRRTWEVRLRTRAQMVLLAAEQHLTAAAIAAAIVRESEETVRRWLKRSQAEGVEGLRDQHRGGAPAAQPGPALLAVDAAASGRLPGGRDGHSRGL